MQRDVRFLVKAGEDLRLDQRVQLVFRLMNRMLTSNPQCASRGLCMRTYEVMPLNDRLGLIEWMDRTAPLKTVIAQQTTRDAMNRAQAAYHKNYKEGTEYLPKFRSTPAATIERELNAAQACLPPSPTAPRALVRRVAVSPLRHT